MISVKEGVKKMIDGLPDEATVEDIQYALYVRERVERGLREIDEGHFVSHEEAMRQLDQWREK